jgi:hypothetical protein
MSVYRNIMKRTLNEINPGEAYFAEMSKGMSPIEKKVLNNLIDEYDFGKVMYVFRNQIRAFKAAIKSGVVLMKAKRVKK